MGTRIAATAIIAALLAGLLAGCTASDPAVAARSDLSTVVDASIAKFDGAGGSETTSDGTSQYALIFDPSGAAGKQVVTVDLSDPESPAFAGSTPSIRSMRTLLDSSEFATAEVEHSGDEFVATGAGFSATIKTRTGLVSQITLKAAAADGPSQMILVSYGISPEAQTLFDSAK